MAGRSLRQAFTNLAGGVTISAEALGKYEYSSMNSNGTAKDLKTVLDELRTAFSQMTQQEQVANAETIAMKTGRHTCPVIKKFIIKNIGLKLEG